MPNTLDFKTLTLKDALDFAVLIEDEARERYVEFAEQMVIHRSPEIARFFTFMAENEARHGRDLATRRKALFGDASSTVTVSMVWDVEASEYEKAQVFMSEQRALEVALACEIKAHDFFVAALPHVGDPEAKSLFDELRREEILHQDLLRAEMAKLRPDAGPDLAQYADPPVAL